MRSGFLVILFCCASSVYGQAGYYYHSSWQGPPQMPSYQGYNPYPIGSSAYYSQKRMNSYQNQGNWIAYKQDMYFYNLRKSQNEMNKKMLEASFSAGRAAAEKNQAAKIPQEVKNDPDSKSSLHKPSSPDKVKLIVLRPNNDWSLFDWEIVLNGKFYAPIEAREYKILEIEPGQYDMTCGTMGVGTCIRFKANGGSTQYVTAEWERFTVLPTSEGEALFKKVQENKNSANRLTPGSGSKRSKYSTR